MATSDKLLMNRAADNIRILVAAMVEKARSGHPGGAMGGADFINVLFSEFLIFDPDNPQWEGRDRFFLDPGHLSSMLYAALALAGKYTMAELAAFRQWGSPTPGHPERNVMRGIENTSGPLGQGHTYAVGAAIAAKFLKARLQTHDTAHPSLMNHTIYAYISDGGIQEEVSQGAGRIAGTLGLDNLIMFYDANNVQLSTKVDEVTSEDVAAKYRAWGWLVISIDGNDPDAIRQALTQAKAETQRPTLIIGATIMGKGARTADGNLFEGKVSTHGQPLSSAGASFDTTVKALGGDPNDPFRIFPDTQALYDARTRELRAIVDQRRNEHNAWTAAHPDLANKLNRWFAGDLPPIDWASIAPPDNQPTRVASAAALSVLAERVDNMICASADLCNSDKTDGFLNKTHAFTRGDFSGAFLQAGVAELTMACICIGMTLHGGVIAACGAFFVFSDYMKPAIRMAALMQTPVKFIFSHDAFRVGEDGPTHQPVEQEAQIRLLEQLQNHQGCNSLLAIRPADAAETIVAWQMAINNADTPTVLILTRQSVPNLPAKGSRYQQALNATTHPTDPSQHNANNGKHSTPPTPSLPSYKDRYQQALGATKGAYIIDTDNNPDIILFASGSEVAILLEAAKLLRADNIQIRIVSVPSQGRFREQPPDYQLSIFPPHCKTFGLTAGLPATLQALAGSNGKVWGLNSFGYSAPANVLNDHFGFSPRNIYLQAKSLLQ